MKLQRTTLFLLVTALSLGGFVYYSEIQRTQKQEAVKTTKQPIFSFKEDQIQSLTIYIDEETLEFERVSEPLPGWRMKTPKNTAASDAAVAFLLDLLVEGKSDRSFTVPANQNQLHEYGLDKPLATVRVQLQNQEIHRLILGKPNYNRSFLYAQADPSNQTPQPLKVLLVPLDFEYAVNRPISEWESKQEKINTPKPSPTATTNSPKPSPTATTNSPKPSPTATTNPPKPSPTATTNTPKPSPTATTNTPKPSPTATTNSPKPSPTASTPKPSPTATTNSPKPSPTATTNSPKPSPAA